MLFFILRCFFCITYGTKNTELYFMYTSAFEMYTFESEEYLSAMEVVIMPKHSPEPLVQPGIPVLHKHCPNHPPPKVTCHGLQLVSKPGDLKPLDVDNLLSFGAPG